MANQKNTDKLDERKALEMQLEAFLPDLILVEEAGETPKFHIMNRYKERFATGTLRECAFFVLGAIHIATRKPAFRPLCPN